ncbi:MAG TPA: type II secretion system major pseudopilin GspG [Candidatus Omnitrophota bacterium]|nr:type II secretion system major pseudopilin GspG [Candidatus Omnitrophota bacterium]
MDRKGFTLIELLIVIIILGILASLAIPRLAGRTEEARIQAARSDIEGGLSTALDLYEMDMGKYPARLEDLIRKPAGGSRWKGPYFKKRNIPLDPWKHPYVYRFPGTNNNSEYDLSSNGPDGIEGNQDDITNWNA